MKPTNIGLEIISSFLAGWIWVYGSELCLLLHLHEDETAGLHAILNWEFSYPEASETL